MLGKLIKNEFKAGIHSIAFIYLAALGASAVLALSLIFDITAMVAISLTAVFIVAIAIVIVTFFFLIINFNKSCYKDQGYLTFTLPVTSGQLLFAKALASFIWLIISYVVAIGMLLAAAKYVGNYVGEEDLATAKIALNMFIELPTAGLVASAISLLLAKIFIVIIGLVALVFFSVSISNIRVFQAHSTVFAIIIFFVLFLLTTLVANLLQAYFPLTIHISPQAIELTNTSLEEGGFALGVADSVFELIYSAFAFIISAWFMNHKINLK